MHGFDNKFKTFPDYILGITHEIWEQRGVETLNHYYSDDIVVRSPSSVVVGNQAVIKATYATLDEFPDRQLLGEDVIWCGTPEAGMSFLSKIRLEHSVFWNPVVIRGSRRGTFDSLLSSSMARFVEDLPR